MPKLPSKLKKAAQLGMDPGTARHHLATDLLFDFVQRAGHVCHRCGGPLTRDSFTIDHIEPWLDSSDPHRMFFSLENIAYSHSSCNFRDARRTHRIPDETLATLSPKRQKEVQRSRAKDERRRAAADKW